MIFASIEVEKEERITVIPVVREFEVPGLPLGEKSSSP